MKVKLFKGGKRIFKIGIKREGNELQKFLGGKR
jgi:hypothetical protein